jgi:hypothetical protein
MAASILSWVDPFFENRGERRLIIVWFGVEWKIVRNSGNRVLEVRRQGLKEKKTMFD